MQEKLTRVRIIIGRNLELENELTPEQVVSLLDIMDVSEEEPTTPHFITNFPKIERES